MSGWRRLKRLALLLSAISILAGCTTTHIFATEQEAEVVAQGEAAGRSAVCRAWRAITYSRQDTAETQREIRGNNAARAGYGCPP